MGTTEIREEWKSKNERGGQRVKEHWWEQSGFQSVVEVFIIQYVCGQEELCNEEQISPNHWPLLTIADHYTQWALTILDLCYLQVTEYIHT